MVIKHWRIHNYISRDRYKETNYKLEKSSLSIDENGSYSENVPQLYTECIQNVDTDKIRIDKNKEEIPFDLFWSLYPKKVEKKKSEEKWKRLKLETQKLILEDIPKRKLSISWVNGYILNPMTYLNGERWNDEIKTDSPKSMGDRKVDNFRK